MCVCVFYVCVLFFIRCRGIPFCCVFVSCVCVCVILGGFFNLLQRYLANKTHRSVCGKASGFPGLKVSESASGSMDWNLPLSRRMHKPRAHPCWQWNASQILSGAPDILVPQKPRQRAFSQSQAGAWSQAAKPN